MSPPPPPPPPPTLSKLSTLFPSPPRYNRGFLSRLTSLFISRIPTLPPKTNTLSPTSTNSTTITLPPLLDPPSFPPSQFNLLSYLFHLSHRDIQFSTELSSSTVSKNKRKGLNITIGYDYLRAFNSIIGFLLVDGDGDDGGVDRNGGSDEVEIQKLRLASLICIELAIHHRSLAWSVSSLDNDETREVEEVQEDNSYSMEEIERRMKLMDLGIIALALNEDINFVNGKTLKMIRTDVEGVSQMGSEWNLLPKVIKSIMNGLTSHVCSRSHLEISNGFIEPTYLHTLLLHLSTSLSTTYSTNIPPTRALLQGIQPNIDPETVFDWVKLKIAIDRVAIGLGVISREMKTGKGSSKKEQLVELGDHDDVVMQEEKDEGVSSIKEEGKKIVKIFNSGFQVNSSISQFVPSNNPSTVDPATDLLHILQLIESLIVRHDENSPHGAIPEDMRVLVKRRPWIVRRDESEDEEEMVDGSEREDGEITTLDEDSEASDTNGEGESSNGNVDPSETTPESRGTHINVETPQPILTTLFTLYDRYIEQRRAIWMDLPTPKIKCDRFTETGEVGIAWRRVVGRLTFGVLGTATMLEHGMDDDQLDRWQEEEDDALRGKKRRKLEARRREL